MLFRHNQRKLLIRKSTRIIMSTQPQSSSSTAKHLQANTFGRNPHLMPYILDHCNEHPLSKDLRSEIEKEERAIMSGSPDEGVFFKWFLPIINAKKVIEVGVFRGATTLNLALALPEDGKVVGLDVSAEYAATGQKYWEKAGVSKKIDFRLGDANAELDKLIANGEEGTFDFSFIDADKVNYPQYYEKSLKLLRKGGVIAVDNCLWGGGVVEQEWIEKDKDTRTLAELNTFIKNDKRVEAVMLPIADGIYFARKL